MRPARQRQAQPGWATFAGAARQSLGAPAGFEKGRIASEKPVMQRAAKHLFHSSNYEVAQ
ncbi:hypothetical protein AXW84_07005 [Hymenobacter sp. PAMC 26628]|nr:hypothetical protein AXW84_07005 [Hymenobacter sp. PAMC 26628]